MKLSQVVPERNIEEVTSGYNARYIERLCDISKEMRYPFHAYEQVRFVPPIKNPPLAALTHSRRTSVRFAIVETMHPPSMQSRW